MSSRLYYIIAYKILNVGGDPVNRTQIMHQWVQEWAYNVTELSASTERFDG